MTKWIYDSPPEGCDLFHLPSLAARKGAERLACLSALLGKEKAMESCLIAGKYLLEDDLVRQLSLNGVRLGFGGEIHCLSPERWKLIEDDMIPGKEVRGILLDKKRRKSFEHFLAIGKSPKDPMTLVKIAESYFFQDSLNLVVEYTAPRFKP